MFSYYRICSAIKRNLHPQPSTLQHSRLAKFGRGGVRSQGAAARPRSVAQVHTHSHHFVSHFQHTYTLLSRSVAQVHTHSHRFVSHFQHTYTLLSRSVVQVTHVYLCEHARANKHTHHHAYYVTSSCIHMCIYANTHALTSTHTPLRLSPPTHIHTVTSYTHTHSYRISPPS